MVKKYNLKKVTDDVSVIYNNAPRVPKPPSKINTILRKLILEKDTTCVVKNCVSGPFLMVCLGFVILTDCLQQNPTPIVQRKNIKE